ncbi:hypothetical protein DFH29DRAFT_983453 [Suillus ampliporus]|nr:hypothetical protein DFH29DRAFT_983453 [Suillus ampliporus]
MQAMLTCHLHLQAMMAWASLMLLVHRPHQYLMLRCNFMDQAIDYIEITTRILMASWPCDENGVFLPPGTPPPPPVNRPADDWTPFRDRVEFETAELLYIDNQMSATKIDRLLNLWAATLAKHNNQPPFADHQDLYHTIDSSALGEVKWESFQVQYSGEKPDVNVPSWMDNSFDVWFRDPREVVHNMLANPTYSDEINYRLYCEYASSNDERQWKDFMSGDWAWDQADKISKDSDTVGAMFVPVILGSDKTTVSVGTGNNEYYPLYVSIGNVRNNVRRAHQDAVAIVGFLAIPKTKHQFAADPRILQMLKPGMTTPEVARFGDGHFRRVIYGLGPYIADYEEQVLLACIVRGWCPRCLAHHHDLDHEALVHCREYTDALVEEGTLGELWDDYGIVGDLIPFTNDFPRADINQLIAPDILHQLIKGAFDHLVTWVEKYLEDTYTKCEAERCMDDIDQRIATVASFSGLQCFPEGRGFKQWTGDDLKALMKVYLPAIEGHVPADIMRAFRALLEFCYCVRHNIISQTTLLQIQDALARFHQYHGAFNQGCDADAPIVATFSLSQQHSLLHYPRLIQLFGTPNGLCSSITESKHIKAVKEPWWRSSRFNALGQMLRTNQWLDKLTAMCADFTSRGMMNGTVLSMVLEALQQKRVKAIPVLATELNIPHLSNHLHQFLFEQLHPDDPRDLSNIPELQFPSYQGRISVFNSASSRFYAPSDISGIGGMRTKYIRACSLWWNEAARYNCVFVNTNPDMEGMQGLDVARVLCFFSFTFRGTTFPCTVVHWFDTIGNSADEDTGMWVVRPGFTRNCSPNISIIHVDAIFHTSHLIPVWGTHFVSHDLKFHQSYDSFQFYYVNKYADHHAFEIAY